MRFTTLSRLFAMLAVIALLVPSVVLAQGIVTGAVAGTITDSTGAVVSNAKVTLKSEDTGEVLTQVTSSTGSFNFTLLKPGAYRLTLSQQGFKGVSEKLDVALGQTTTANLKLEIGSAAETVEVSAVTPLLQTEDANISTTYNAAQIESLPSPGGVWAWRRGGSITVAVNLSNHEATLDGVDGAVCIATDRARDGERCSKSTVVAPWEGLVVRADG